MLSPFNIWHWHRVLHIARNLWLLRLGFLKDNSDLAYPEQCHLKGRGLHRLTPQARKGWCLRFMNTSLEYKQTLGCRL